MLFGSKKRIAASLVVLLAVLAAVAGGLFWWFMQQPLYTPGGLAAHPNLEPHGSDQEEWEVAPGIELHHFATGEGRNVLVVHGGPGIPPTASAPAFDALGDSHRFYYYDQRGSGLSYRPEFDFSGSQWDNIQQLDGALGITEQLADIERIRRLLGDEKLILVGHSYGAFLAALYAAELPTRVEKLILIAPADLIVFPSRHGGLFDNMREKLPPAQREAFDDWLMLYLDLGNIFGKTEAELQALDAELFIFFEAAAGPSPPAVAPPQEHIGSWHARAQFFGMGRRHDYASALGAVTAPTLIVHGTEDLQPIDVAEDYAAWIDDTQVVTIEGAGHFPHYTHAGALAPILRGFLGAP
jgi:proline iminopeptidase